MIIDADQRLDWIFESYRQIERDLISKQRNIALTHLRDALRDSCSLLRDFEQDATLDLIVEPPRTVALFKSLKARGRIDSFLNVERILLQNTKLKQNAIDDLVEGLRRIIDRYIEKDGRLESAWRATLTELQEKVCSEAQRVATSLEAQPFLRRAFFGGGGLLVAGINILPPFAIALPVGAASVSLGVWMLHEATSGLFDSWFKPSAD